MAKEFIIKDIKSDSDEDFTEEINRIEKIKDINDYIDHLRLSSWDLESVIDHLKTIDCKDWNKINCEILFCRPWDT